MNFVIFFVCVFVLGIALLAFMSNAVETGASTLPLGTVRTFVYTGKSGGLSEQFSKMGMEHHINLMITNGWEVVNQVGLAGHVRLGRTLTGAALTGGLSLLAGGSRTADRVTITYRRVEIPVSVTPEAAVGSAQLSTSIADNCTSCGSKVQVGARFCPSCGVTVDLRQAPEVIAPAAFCSKCGGRIRNSQGICVHCTNDDLDRAAVPGSTD
jgi:hypothetical protein